MSVPQTEQRDQGKLSRWGQGRGGRPWRRIRDRILRRDAYLCQHCERAGDLTLATEVDHIVPIFEGGTDADGNLESICETCHALKTDDELQRARAGRSTTMTPTEIPPPMRPLWVICGPPGSGKSTLVRRTAGPGDLIIDLDDLSAEHYRVPMWQLDQAQRGRLLALRNDLLRQYCHGSTDHPQAWLIIGVPGERHRRHWTKIGGRVQVLSTDLDVCRARVRDRHELPEDVRAEQLAVIDRWE